LNNLKFSTDEIKQFKGLDTLTEEQAEVLADFLETYAVIIYNSLKH